MIMMFIIHSSLENRIIRGIEALIHEGLPNYPLRGNTLNREGAGSWRQMCSNINGRNNVGS